MSRCRDESTGQELLIGIDVGATKTAAILGRPDGTIVARRTAPTVRGNPQRLADALGDLVEALLVEARAASSDQGVRPPVGIGICGHVDNEAGLLASPIALDWPGPAPLGELLRRRLGLEVALENDVNAAVLGEIRWGAGRSVESFLHVNVGTGIGAGIVLNGRLYRGANRAAGELGHMVIDPDGPPCLCGNRGCLEVLAGGKGLTEWVRREIARRGRSETSPRLAAILAEGGPLSAADIFAAASDGDIYCRDVVARVGEYLAIAVTNLINLLDPERIVLGGGVSLAGPLLLSALESARQRWRPCLVDGAGVVELSSLGSDAGVLGALAVALEGKGAVAAASRDRD